MAMHERDATSEKDALFSAQRIMSGQGQGAIELGASEKIGNVDNPIYKGFEWLGKYFGWITSYKPIERKPKPPPKPPEKAGSYSRNFIDSEIEAATKEYANIARGYANSARDINRKGWNLFRLPSEEMTYDPDGWETGVDIFENETLYGMDGLKVRGHEIMGKGLRAYGFDHNDRADRAIRSLEEPMAMAYIMGERNVADRFTRLAIDALRN